MIDCEISTKEFDRRRQFYNECYSLGNLGCSIQDKFALIGLICYVTDKAKQKQPATHYQIIKGLSKGLSLPESFICGLAIMCEDFAYESKEFPTFGVESKDIVSTVRNILNTYMPF